MYKQQINKNEN